MRFLHLGDLHLGKSLGEFDLIEDQKYILEQVLSVAKKHCVDGVFLAGDIYDKAIPSEAAVRLLDWFLNSLAASHIKTFLISGNHDSDERLNFGSKLFEEQGIYISSKFQGNMLKHTLQDEYGEICVYLLPFVKASMVKHFYPEASIQSYEDAVRRIIEHEQIDESKRNILVAHQFVIGGRSELLSFSEPKTAAEKERAAQAEEMKTIEPLEPQLGGSEGLSTQQVGLVEKIGAQCFDQFDYVALGHIHSPQKVGREEVRYSGSLLKYSLSEVNNDKSIPLITFQEKGEVSIELIPLKPMRELRHLKGTLKQLLGEEHISNPQDFIYATLTQEDVVNDVMGLFQQYYPNTVKVDYENNHTKELEEFDFTQFSLQKPFDELMNDFYTKMYGISMGEEEISLMREVAREAGVMDETN